MFNFIRRIFKRKQKIDVSHLRRNLNSHHDPATDKETKSSIMYDRNNDRFLKLNDTDVALVIHDKHIIEVVLTKMRDANQAITEEEDLLMSLALFLKQREFCEMLTKSFHDLAMRKLGPYAEKKEGKPNDNE